MGKPELIVVGVATVFVALLFALVVFVWSSAVPRGFPTTTAPTLQALPSPAAS